MENEKFVNENVNTELTYKEIAQILRLKKLIDEYEDKDVNEVENEFFKKYNCNNEIQKIMSECNYVKRNLNDKKDMYINDVLYNEDLKLIDAILNNIKKVKLIDIDRIRKVKKALIAIELDFNIGINFISEVKEMYDNKLYSLEQNDRKKGM